jgi:hypothetical protein
MLFFDNGKKQVLRELCCRISRLDQCGKKQLGSYGLKPLRFTLIELLFNIIENKRWKNEKNLVGSGTASYCCRVEL